MKKQLSKISDQSLIAKWKDETPEQKQIREAAEAARPTPHGSRRKPGRTVSKWVSESEHRNAVGISNGESELEKWERYYDAYVPSDLNSLLYQSASREQMGGTIPRVVPIDQESELIRIEAEWDNANWKQMGGNLLMLTAMLKYWKDARELVNSNSDPLYDDAAKYAMWQCDTALKRINIDIAEYKDRLRKCEKNERRRRELEKIIK